MMKRIMSLFLVLAILVPTLCACSDSGSGEKRPRKKSDGISETQQNNPNGTGVAVEIDGDLGITDEFVEMLSASLVMRLNSSYSYRGGAVSANDENAAPLLIDNALYLPAAFVAKSFGAETEWDPENQMLSVWWDDHSMTICATDEYMVVDGENAPLPSTSVVENNVLLTPAEPLCDELGQTVEQVDNLVIIGDGLSEVTKGISEDAKTLVFSSMDARLGTVNGWEFDSSRTRTYEEWVACTKSIVLDPNMAPWSSPKDQLAAVTGSLYVENISITPAANDTYDCTMDVYNYMGYTYGAVEVYGPDDRLLEVERIKPFAGQQASPVQAVCDVGVLMGDVAKAWKHWDLDYMDYKSSLNSEIRKGLKVNVPVDGYVIITVNPLHSDRVAAYNMIHTLVEVMFAVDDLKVGGSKESAKALIKDYLIEELSKEATMIPEMAAEFRIFLSNIADENWVNLPEFAQVACDSLMDAVNRMEFDFWGAVQNAVKEAGHSLTDFLVEEFVTKVLPGGDKIFLGWKITTNVSNLVCMFMDLNTVTNAKSLMLENFNWKAAYSKILREFPRENVQGTLTFATGYVNDDMVPELIIIDAVAHFGNTMYMYTYDNRRIVPVLTTTGETEFNVPNATFAYAEMEGIVVRADMNRGYVSEVFDQLQGTQFQRIHSFSNDEGAVGDSSGATYQYNNATVARWYYNWKLESLQIKYQDTLVSLSGFTMDEVTEANIKRYFES